jgi:hypothetical protein
MRRAARNEVARPIPALTLREACIARGINPENPGYRVPVQRITSLDRIIPGVADRKSPYQLARERGLSRPEGVRKEYTRGAAETHRSMIRDGGTAAYVALFNQLNHLVEA